MARKNQHPEVSRRKFLAGVAVAGAATTVAAPPDVAGAATPPAAAARVPSALPPSAQQIAAETELPKVDSPLGGRAGSDFMVDVIKSLGIEYVYANPASSYRGIHESLINYGKNTMPEFITCMHEESSIAMAHGYFKVAGKPALVLCHGVVGLMHGTMSIYNAWCDRAPVIVMGGTDLDAANRPPGVPTTHSGQDINALVRDFTKWDDTPVSLAHFAQSFVRAYKFAMTPPHEPVMLALDAELQEMPIQERERNRLVIPKYAASSPPQADVAALRETAKLLVNAANPVIVADRVARTPAGMKHLVELAELLQAPVVNMRGRMNFPNSHYLSQPPGQLYAQADLILGLEVTDFWNVVNSFTDNADNEGIGTQRRRAKSDAKLITINSVELNQKSNYQDFQRFQPVDISMVGDAEASLPSLIEAVKMAMSNDKQAAYEKRGEAFKKAKAAADERAMAAAAVGWDATPISTARLAAELWGAVKDHDWALVNASNGTSGWPERFFKIDRHYQWIGGSGGAGQGYGVPAAIGAAHAHKPLGRLAVAVIGDGDSMYAPGALWTAARHQIPLLSIVHNNRGYHQEVMHVQRLSNRRNRLANNGKDFGPVGTRIENPNIDYAMLAKSMGMQSFGPVTDPNELGPALKKAVQVAKAGEPVLVDPIMQPR
jgi:thiamine pyrophosphate-dependent acetolactate synthase large subunit-like protein